MLMDIHTFFPTLGSAVLARRVHSSLLDPDCLAPFTTPLLSAAAVVASPFVFLHRLGFYFYFFPGNGCHRVQRGIAPPHRERSRGEWGRILGFMFQVFKGRRRSKPTTDAHRQKANNDGASQ